MSASRHLPHDWFPAPLPPNVEIGEGSWLYSSFAFLHCRSRRPRAVRIGKSSGIYNSSFFELGPDGEVSIGDYCTLVGAIIATNGRVRIGDYCFVAHEVSIVDGPFATPARAMGEERNANAGAPVCIDLGNDVWIGTGAILMRGAKIGDGAIIGAAAIVDFEVPAYAIVAGNPGKIVGFAPGSRATGSRGDSSL